MAFVYKEDRFTNRINSKFENTPGPGHYLSTDTSKQAQDQKIPFISSEQKLKREKILNTPGPGSYFSSNYYQNKNLKTDSNNDNVIYKILDYDEITHNSKFAHLLEEKIKPTGFSNKAKRFNQKEYNDNPGPGHYNRTDLNFFENNTMKIEKEMQIKNNYNTKTYFYKPEELKTTGNYSGPVSIPGKNKSFGYKINDNGFLVSNTPNTTYTSDVSHDIYTKTLASWTNKPSVASIWTKSKLPKSYLMEKEKMNKTAFNNRTNNLHLLRQETEIPDYLTTDPDYNNDSNNGNNILRRPNRNTTYKKNASIHNKRVKQLSQKKPILNSIKTECVNQISKLIDSNEDSTPGPGYYFPSIIENIATSSESFQCFGSRTNRFNNSNLINNDLPGPGAYYKTQENKLNKKRNKAKSSMKFNMNMRINDIDKKKLNTTFSVSNRADNFLNKLKNSPGPGYYNTSSNWKKNINPNTQGKFGSSEDRFPIYKAENTDQGPGSYLQLDTFKPKFNSNLKVNKNKIHEDRLDFRVNKNDVVPSVGSYDPDIIHNIDYNLHKKVSKVSAVFAPFNSLQRRFNKVKKDKYLLNLGPGYYHKESKIIDKFNNGVSFNSTSQRNFDMGMKNIVGPAKYNMNSWFDWNKKSFNINFI